MGETIGQRGARMALNRALRKERYAPSWRALVEAMSSSRYVGHSETKAHVTTLKFSSREDGRVTLRVRVGSGLIATSKSGFTDSLIMEAVWKSLVDRFGLFGLIGDLEDSTRGFTYSQKVEIVMERMREDAGPFFDQISSAVNDLSGKYARRAEDNMTRGIISGLRGEIAQALSKGVSRDMIQQILDEETVKSVQEE